METQTFRAQNVMTALEEVQRKMGPEAIVVSVRQVPPGPAWQVWRSPEVEVIAMRAAPGGLAPGDNLVESHVEEKKDAPTPAARVANPPGSKAESNAKKPVITPLADVLPHLEKSDRPRAKPSREEETPKTGVKPVDPVSPGDREKTAMMAIAALTAAARAAAPQIDHASTSSASPASAATPPAAAPAALPAAGAAVSASTPPVAPDNSPASLPLPLASMKSRLLSQGVDESLVSKLVNTCQDTLSLKTLKDEARLRDHIRQQLQALMRTRVSGSLVTSKVTCLIGMSGSGKTISCAKLAAYHSRQLGQKVAWVCADTISAGAISEAQVYTDALGIPLSLAYTPAELSEAVKSQQGADIVLVDTPGCNPFNETSLIELGDFLTVLENRLTYLVASATSKDADLLKSLSTLSAFNLKGLIITRLDETGSFGNVFNLAWRSQLPLVFFSSGRRVPDDLQPAQPGQLISAIFGEGWVS